MSNRPVIIVLSSSGLPVAKKIRSFTDGEIHGLASRVENADMRFDDTAQHIAKLFQSGRVIIGIMASGAVIRLVAPHLKDKHSEPAVLSVSDDGASVVPLLGGHHGANQIARVVAEHLGGHAAITTAGDVHFGVALDEPPSGWVLANPDNAKACMAELLAGATVRLTGTEAGTVQWIVDGKLPIADNGAVSLVFGEGESATDLSLSYFRRNVALGIGCERGVSLKEVETLVESVLADHQIDRRRIACIASIDVKADEAALHYLAEKLAVPLRFFSAEVLEAETPRLATPSEVVFQEVGCHGVAEGAALAMVGSVGQLLVAKQKSKRATVALAAADGEVKMDGKGRKQGHLSVVGIGPGNEAWRSPEVTRLVSAATDLVGYSLYLDLLAELTDGKTRHDFDLGKEEDRVRHAMELAGEGKNVALVCSGDAGIYAMATLVYELLADGGLSDAAQRISIQVSPGISALQAAAARAGAPLGHDFCTISLSDLLTPWLSIQMRVKAAAEGDFVIAFYNPVSKRRRTQLAYARDVLLEHRPEDTPVILATNLGREGELVRVVPLAKLNIDDVDMLTVVIVGSSDTRTVQTGDGKTWVYTPRGYAAKEDTKIGSAA